MVEISKGKSPFNPGQPVPVELFTGRVEQIQKIIDRGVAQVAAGKPEAIYVQGEYGIGKTSVAGFAQWLADRDFGLHSVYCALGACKDLHDVIQAILVSTISSGVFNPRRSESIRNWLAKYIGKQGLFGINIDFQALKQDIPTLTNPNNILDFLREVIGRLSDTGVKGVFIVFDEINGIASDPQFAHFIKDVVDTNALQKESVPILLMLCGVKEKRWELIQRHKPIERIFNIIEIDVMTNNEMVDFFNKAFDSVGMKVDKDAMNIMTHYSAGFPKIMHLVGDAAFWTADDNVINIDDAKGAVIIAADDVGEKFAEQQVYSALRSKDYLEILNKIAVIDPVTMTFSKADIGPKLTNSEKKKFPDFLRRMQELKVIKKGDTQGEYVFISRMFRLYVWMKSIKVEK